MKISTYVAKLLGTLCLLLIASVAQAATLKIGPKVNNLRLIKPRFR